MSPADQTGPGVDAQGRTALVVDDEDDVRELIAIHIQKLGFQVLQARNPAEADAVLDRADTVPDLFMVDVVMPGENGLAFVKRLRTDARFAGVPAIFFSGRFTTEQMRKIRTVFPDVGLLTKPYRFEEIRDAVHRLLPPPPPEAEEPRAAAAEAEGEAKGEEDDEERAFAESFLEDALAGEDGEEREEETPGAEGELREGEAPEEATYVLDVDHDGLVARLLPPVRGATSGLLDDPEEVFKLLNEEGVTYGIDRNTVYAAFTGGTVRYDREGGIVVAQGRQPVHGEPGSVEFTFDTSGQPRYRGAEEEDGSQIDFRSAVSYEKVEEGQTLARIIPPGKGRDGLSLKGNPVPAKDGKPVHLTVGDGAQLQGDGETVVASRSGRPLLKGHTLVVSNQLQVEGDVDLSVGNIDFNGVVTVGGNVLEDFVIRATALEVHGVAGACTLEIEGNALIHGGINGQGRAVIRTGGTLEAKYINQAQVTANADVTVRREIVNSRVWSYGKVMSGKILGGECLALGGIEADVLGSEMGVKTLLEPGVNFEARRLEQEIHAVDAQIERLIRPVENFFGDRQRFRSLPPEKQEEFRKAYHEFEILKDKHLELAEQKRALLDRTSATAVKQVRFRKAIYPDVVIRTDLCLRQFEQVLRGPLLMLEDINNSTIVSAREKEEEDKDKEKTS